MLSIGEMSRRTGVKVPTIRFYEQKGLLEAAAALPLPPEQEEERQDLLETVMPADGWTPEAIAGFELGPVPREVHDFLRGLRFLL